MKLSKREKNKIQSQMKVNHRGDTWVGIRPVVFKSKQDIKSVREESKRLCRSYS